MSERAGGGGRDGVARVDEKKRVLWLLAGSVVSGNSGVFPLYLERIFYYSIDRVVLFMSSYRVGLDARMVGSKSS